MEKLISFLKIISWAIGPITAIIGILKLYLQINYHGSLSEKMDNIKGIRAIFNPWPFLIVSLICFAFIIAFW